MEKNEPNLRYLAVSAEANYVYVRGTVNGLGLPKPPRSTQADYPVGSKYLIPPGQPQGWWVSPNSVPRHEERPVHRRTALVPCFYQTYLFLGAFLRGSRDVYV